MTCLLLYYHKKRGKQQNDNITKLDNNQDFYINTYNINGNTSVSTLTLNRIGLAQIWLVICNASNVIGEDTQAAYLIILW